MQAHMVTAAVRELGSGMADWRLWLRFGWHDIVARFRRSWIGPVWLTASISVFIGALGFVYSTLFNVEITEYLPYLAIGVVTWTFIAAIAGESGLTFVESEVYIRQMRRSLMVYAMRVVWRNVIVFANQLVVALLVVWILRDIHWETLPLVFLGVALLILQALWVTLLVGILGARFRDLQSMIQIVLQIMFLITPVIWPPRLLGSKSWIADYNPVHHCIEIVRAPLMGQIPELGSYVVAMAILLIGASLAIILYARFRTRVIYWL
jgi:ABC-type polysaccharide/polyol phosphate export permease